MQDKEQNNDTRPEKQSDRVIFMLEMEKKALKNSVLAQKKDYNLDTNCIKIIVLIWLREWDLNLTTSGLWAT